MVDPEPKPKLCWWQFRRGWLRFSLRSLLVLLTVACLGLGWLVNRANQQRQAAQWVTEFGGRIYYDYEIDENDAFVEDAEPPGPDWLCDLIGIDYFANLEWLALTNTQVSDLTPLANLTNLKWLVLYDTQVRDLTPLAKLTNLEWLYLQFTQVSDLTPLANLTNLEWLYLEGTQVSDLTPLANLKNLEWLNLEGTQVSDLTPLANLTNLEMLMIFGTQVSKEECDELQRSLPDLEIFRE